MKVFVVDPSLFTLPYDQAFCRGLAEAGAEVTLVGRPLRPEERLIEGGFAFRPLFYPKAEGTSRRETASKALKGLEHARGLAALGRLVRRERPDIVHVQWLVIPLLDRWGYARVPRRAPLVFTAHNSVPLHGSASALQRFGHHAAVRGFARYVAHTEQTAAHLAALGIERARITVLAHPPLELPCRPRQAAAEGPVRILLFGALKPYKGVDVLVRAALGLARRGRDFRVAIAGKPFFSLDGLRAEIAAAGAAERFDSICAFCPTTTWRPPWPPPISSSFPIARSMPAVLWPWPRASASRSSRVPSASSPSRRCPGCSVWCPPATPMPWPQRWRS